MEQLQAVDEGTLFWFESHHWPWLTTVMKSATFLGERWPALAVVLTAVLLFWIAGRPRSALILALTALLGLCISQGCKYVVQRARPDVAWKLIDRPHSPSFPSGHALHAMAIYGTIALLASRGLRSRSARWVVIALGLGLSLLIGISRPYLGVHYPSDVLAGWTAGLACALLGYWADRRWEAGEPIVDS